MKKIREVVKDAVIYQINLRVFTKEGTLAAAEDFLPDVAATGADVVYLCPIVESDADPDQRFWSSRQKTACTNNPRNPYRIRDYFTVDREYGTDDDLRSFVKKAHSLGIKVMLDLVYLHAGPTFGKEHPELVKKDADGNVKLNSYSFCEIDFASPELREYLWNNMEYFVKEFDIDGYRCDVGGQIPLDFWVEGRRRVEKIKKPFIMLNEYRIQFRKEDQDEAFDINYSPILTGIFEFETPAHQLQVVWHESDDVCKNAVQIRALENHDSANDMYYGRMEKISSAKCEAFYVYCFTVNGVPFLYNGCEYCDTSRHSIFGNKGEFTIDRSKDPAQRTAFLAGLARLHREEEALRNGEMKWEENSDLTSICTYTRTAPNGEKIFCAINFANREVTVSSPAFVPFANGSILLARGAETAGETFTLEANGFLVIKL